MYADDCASILTGWLMFYLALGLYRLARSDLFFIWISRYLCIWCDCMNALVVWQKVGQSRRVTNSYRLGILSNLIIFQTFFGKNNMFFNVLALHIPKQFMENNLIYFKPNRYGVHQFSVHSRIMIN